MKIQDIIFFLVFLFLAYKKDSKFTLTAGLLSILFSIPLFYLHIFFTAQHLLYYSWAFILLTVLIILLKEKTV
jgi:hypothetical protein